MGREGKINLMLITKVGGFVVSTIGLGVMIFKSPRIGTFIFGVGTIMVSLGMDK